MIIKAHIVEGKLLDISEVHTCSPVSICFVRTPVGLCEKTNKHTDGLYNEDQRMNRELRDIFDKLTKQNVSEREAVSVADYIDKLFNNYDMYERSKNIKNRKNNLNNIKDNEFDRHMNNTSAEKSEQCECCGNTNKSKGVRVKVRRVTKKNKY